MHTINAWIYHIPRYVTVALRGPTHSGSRVFHYFAVFFFSPLKKNLRDLGGSVEQAVTKSKVNKGKKDCRYDADGEKKKT